MMKFVKKKTAAAATSPQQAVEISRPSNLIYSKHKLVRTEGDFILIMEDDKVIGILDKRDLDVVAVPQHAPPRPPAPSSSSASISPSSPPGQQYLAPLSSNRSAPELEPPVPQSPVGVSPSAYRSLPPGFSTKHHQQQRNPALYQFEYPQNSSSPDQSSAYKWTSVEHLFSPPIPTNTRNRSETGLQPQGSHKYDTITFSPGVQLPGSSSAQCNVEIRLGDERTPPPPTRAPPVPLTMSHVQCAIVLPEETCLGFTEVQSVSVEDPELAGMTIDDMRKHAEDFECFIQEQVQQRWSQEKAETEQWIKNIAGTVAKTETINTIRGEMSRKKRPSLTEVFASPLKSPSLDPSDPEPNHDYERLYVSEQPKSPVKRQPTQESDGDIEDIRF